MAYLPDDIIQMTSPSSQRAMQKTGLPVPINLRPQFGRLQVNKLPSSGRVFEMPGHVESWYEPSRMKQSIGQMASAPRQWASRFAKKHSQAITGLALRAAVATTSLPVEGSPTSTQRILGQGRELFYEQPLKQGRGQRAASKISRGFDKGMSGLGRFAFGGRLNPIGMVKRHPAGAIAALLVGGTALAGSLTAVSGANKSMEYNRMYLAHNKQQRQNILQTQSPQSQSVNPTFSGRRVTGGHMNATGDLTLAMSNRRKSR